MLFSIDHLLTPHQLVLTGVIQHTAVPVITQEGHAKHHNNVMTVYVQTE